MGYLKNASMEVRRWSPNHNKSSPWALGWVTNMYATYVHRGFIPIVTTVFHHSMRMTSQWETQDWW